MAKRIRLTEVDLDKIREEFEQALVKTKASDGKFTFSKTLDKDNRKAKIYFTEIAWLKMIMLVNNSPDEVGWHGIAERVGDHDKDEYMISDIIVYPQSVTGATVTTDQVEYQMWLAEQPDDVFNNLRMQGHSHVNMGTTPSQTDLTLYKNILEQLEDDDFYIFLIWNKKNDKTIKIYDMEKNLYFETADCETEVIPGEIGVAEFISGASELVKKYTPAPKTTTPATPLTTYSAPANTTKPYSTYGSYYPYSYSGKSAVYGGDYDDCDDWYSGYSGVKYSVNDKTDVDEEDDDDTATATASGSAVPRKKFKRKKDATIPSSK